VTVQHVTVSEGGQAIVGDIHQQQRDAAAKSPLALSHSKEFPMEPIAHLPKRAVAIRRKSSK
jgi:hypothetical protein